MFSVLPVVYCKAQPVPLEGKEDKNLYMCPVYKTEDRGNTYVFTAQLKTRYMPRKWILAGVAILMDVEGVSDESTKKAVEKEKKWSNWLLIDIDLFIIYININILKFIQIH